MRYALLGALLFMTGIAVRIEAARHHPATGRFVPATGTYDVNGACQPSFGPCSPEHYLAVGLSALLATLEDFFELGLILGRLLARNILANGAMSTPTPCPSRVNSTVTRERAPSPTGSTIIDPTARTGPSRTRHELLCGGSCSVTRRSSPEVRQGPCA